MASRTLSTLFAEGLQSLYGAHRQGAEQAAANVKTSTSPALRSMLRAGAKQNLAQARRLETVFKSAGLAPKGRRDPAMQGIADANEAMLAQAPGAAARDLATIASGQVAAHFYLATYGTLRSYAQLMGNKKAVKLLSKTLNETSAIDAGFTKLARSLTKRSGAAVPRAARPGMSAPGLLGVALLAVLAVMGDRRRAG